MLEYLVLG